MKNKKIYKLQKHSKAYTVIACSLFTAATVSALSAFGIHSIIALNYLNAIEENKDLLKIYNEKTNEYADYINKLNLESDLDIVVKLMDDIANNVKYGEPKIDNPYFPRLDFTEEYVVGKCRTFADDLAFKLNAINPEYQATTISVYMDGNYNRKDMVDISLERVLEQTQVEQDNNQINISTEYFGNHRVCIFKPIGKDYYLVVDPTNPSIGVIANGGIYLFLNNNENALTFKPIGQIFALPDGDFMNEYEIIYGSNIFRKTPSEIYKLSQEWGVEAQRESLEKIRNLNQKTIIK